MSKVQFAGDFQSPARIADRHIRMWTLEMECITPKTSRSHKTTKMTTTAFKIDLMEPAIGIKLLTSQRRTPTTIKVIRTLIKGIISFPPCSIVELSPPVASLPQLLHASCRAEKHQGAAGENQEAPRQRHVRDLMLLRCFQSDGSNFCPLLSGISKSADEEQHHSQNQNPQPYAKSRHRVSPFLPGKKSGGRGLTARGLSALSASPDSTVSLPIQCKFVPRISLLRLIVDLNHRRVIIRGGGLLQQPDLAASPNLAQSDLNGTVRKGC